MKLFKIRTLSAVSLLSTSLALAGNLPIEALRIGGTIDGFGPTKTDDILDGAIVLPTLRPAALLAFQFENLLGPSEEMSAGPLKVKVPGNFYFPRQRENYGFIPVTITKENFGLHLKQGQSEELHTISFQAPFSKLLEMAQDKKPFTMMLPHLRLQKFGFETNRLWQDNTQIKVAINQNFSNTVPYTWSRKAGGSEASDTIILFQSTPAGRWAITDINGTAAPQGKLNKVSSLGSNLKSFFIRAFTRPKEQAPYAIVGQIRSNENDQGLSAGNLPDKINNIRVEGNNRIVFDAIQKDGWISVAREKKTKSFMNFLTDLSLGLARLPSLQASSEWVNPSQGYIKLDSPIASGESLLLVFVGASRPVSAPSVEDESPELFTYAEEIRMSVIKN